MMMTSFIRSIYQKVLKPFFFKQDPEDVHDKMIGFGKFLGNCLCLRNLTRFLFQYKNPALEQNVLGIFFPNPVGLAAGFDKNAELTKILPAVGFGFEEVGSITGEPCPGNPKPRLWRLPKSRGILVYYGLKNDGAEEIVRRLCEVEFKTPIGTSIARTNTPRASSDSSGVADYVKGFSAFADIGDYFTVNVSCPNTYGGELFGEPDRLEILLSALDKIQTKKPVFVKFSPDITKEKLEAIIKVCDNHRVHGLVISNLTKDRNSDKLVKQELACSNYGGISGQPTAELSNELLSHAYLLAGDRYVLIGVGGIFTATDAYEKIKRGASLVQLATGLIFEGPQLIGEINKGLVDLLHKDGYTNIKEAIGSLHK